MRKFIFAAAAIAVLASAPMAHAAEITGAIEGVDAAGGTITLDDGRTYQLPETVKAEDLKVGAKVTVTYDEAGGKITATAVVPAS